MTTRLQAMLDDAAPRFDAMQFYNLTHALDAPYHARTVKVGKYCEHGAVCVAVYDATDNHELASCPVQIAINRLHAEHCIIGNANWLAKWPTWLD